MTALLDVLDSLAGRPLATVVHVHPVEPELVQRYAALGAHRVVLVSGDPDALPGLRRLLPGRPWLELVEAVVAPQAGEAHWLRYNVPSLNGLLEATGLQAFYPRLRLQERLPVQTRALQAVLDGARLDSGEGANVLVVEVPGLEDALLRGLAATTLQRFEWLLLRGARPGVLRDGADPQAATRWLQAQAWRQLPDEGADQPLWPVAVLQFDTAAAERAALMERVEAGESELRALAAAKAAAEQDALKRGAQLAQLTQERDALLRRIASLSTSIEAAADARAAADKLVRDREAQIEALNRAKTAAEQNAAKQHAENQVLNQAKAALEKSLAEQARRIEQIQAERDAAKAALDKAAADRTQQLDEALSAAEQNAAKQHAENRALNQAKAALEKSLAEQARRIEQIQAERDAAKAALDKAAADRTQQLEQLVKARDEYAKQAGERQKRNVQFDAELAELTARHALLQEELIKSEAHVELIADLLMRESLR